MNYLLAVIIAAAIAFIATAPSRRYIAKPEVWCADPKQQDSGPLGFCEFKLRDA